MLNFTIGKNVPCKEEANGRKAIDTAPNDQCVQERMQDLYGSVQILGWYKEKIIPSEDDSSGVLVLRKKTLVVVEYRVKDTAEKNNKK